jgi:hypothetical protein
MCVGGRLWGGRKTRLRRGELVEVLPAAAILATLDDTGSLGGVPFMPEMLGHLGRRFRVEARVERACDTVCGTGARHMPGTVLLDDLRCDGAAHGGCQAGCRFYWKEAWLRQVSTDEPTTTPSDETARRELERLAEENATRQSDGKTVFRCQATEFFRATEPISWHDLGSLFGEFTCGNVGPWRLVRVGVRVFVTELQHQTGRFTNFPFKKRGGATQSAERLELEPGELVQVRSKREIARTLDESGKNRGLWFDKEMVPFCGKTHRVQARVERFINEQTGELVELKNDCLILEGVVCSGDLSDRRWFCPRAIYPWWREAWLQRVKEPGASEPSREQAGQTRT